MTVLPARVVHRSDENGESAPPLQVSTDIEVIRERLQGVNDKHGSLRALSGLAEAYTTIWHDASEMEKARRDYFLLEDHTAAWCQTFVDTLERGHPLFVSPPVEVLSHLRACRPQLIKDRAWLVMYYSVILSMVSSTEPEDNVLKTELRVNLWLALNDVRLLLEPSETNIQALTLLASHVEEFTTPSLSWMLSATACRMLQALGIIHRRLDSQTRERRVMMFWHLNLVDKGLALSLGRPPSFHRATGREIPLPRLDQLLPFQPHRDSSTGAPSLFEAHKLHQIFQSTRIQADIWCCVYEDTELSDQSIVRVCEDLDAWHSQAKQILEAAAFAEKPFLDAKSAASVDLGLRTVTFSWHYLKILLAKLSASMKKECVDSWREMLHMLPYMVSDSEEPFNGIIWQLVCRPFTPFLALCGEILASGENISQEDEWSLSAMERLPVFLNQMSLRNSLAAKLERVAATFVQHARSLVRPSALFDNAAGPSQMPSRLTEDWPGMDNILDWNTLFDRISGPASAQNEIGASTAVEDLEAWIAEFFGDAVFDWVGPENQG